MSAYHVTRHIEAPPEQVWSILTDPKRLSDGTFSIQRIEGSVAKGQTIRLWSDVDPKRAFAITVTQADAPRDMVWQSGMPMGLFTGTRLFRLTPDEKGTTFEMRETYHGPLAGLMARMIPDLQPSFEVFADGLKAAAESEVR